MSIEQLRNLLAKHDIDFDSSVAGVLNAIASLPTSEICDLFNEIAVHKVFDSDTEQRIF